MTALILGKGSCSQVLYCKVLEELINILRKIFGTSPGFPGGSDGKEAACNAGDLRLISGSGRSPGEGNGNHSSILPGESHGQRSYSQWGRKELDTTEQLTLSLFKSCYIVCQLLPTDFNLS